MKIKMKNHVKVSKNSEMLTQMKTNVMVDKKYKKSLEILNLFFCTLKIKDNTVIIFIQSHKIKKKQNRGGI